MLPLGLATLPPRRGLLYDEQEKTGSGALRRVLPAAVSGCQIAWDGPRGSVYCPIGVSSCNATNACYVAPGPRCGGTHEMWRTHFVIASTREPCDRLNSWFQYKLNASVPAGSEEFKAEFAEYVKHSAEKAVSTFIAAHLPCDVSDPGAAEVRSAAAHVDCWVLMDAATEGLLGITDLVQDPAWNTSGREWRGGKPCFYTPPKVRCSDLFADDVAACAAVGDATADEEFGEADAGLAAGSGVGLRKWYYTSDLLIKQATGWLINDLRTFGYKPMRR